MDYGALNYLECIGDGVLYRELTSFRCAVMATEDDVVVFSWIVHRGRETRDLSTRRRRPTCGSPHLPVTGWHAILARPGKIKRKRALSPKLSKKILVGETLWEV